MRVNASLLFVLLLYSARASAAVTFDWATVGNPGNLADQLYTDNNPGNLRFGAVGYTYRISKHEVTNDQYSVFLNAVDPLGTNPNNVYASNMGANVRGGIAFNGGAASGAKYSTKSNMGNKPVNYVSYLNAMRFVNWLENGQPAGGSGTETGVYTIGNGVNETRAPGANFFLPNEDEWYKAAYYQPTAQGGDSDGYWLYPTASNAVPTIATANAVGDIGNPGMNVVNYNFGADWNGQNGNVTTVGSAGPGSATFYGTFDQGGNIWEWNETVLSSSYHGLRGGIWSNLASLLAASSRNFGGPTDESGGFRVASIPEPSTGLSGTLGMLALLPRRRRPS